MSRIFYGLQNWAKKTPLINKLQRKHLFWLWILVPLAGIFTPIIIVASSQSELISVKTTYIANDDQLYKANASFKDYNKKKSFKNLVYGDTSVSNGNYVLFFSVGGGNTQPQFKSPSGSELENKQKYYPQYSINKTYTNFFSPKDAIQQAPYYIDDYNPNLHQINNLKISSDSAFVAGIKDTTYYNDFNYYLENKINLSFFSLTYDYEKLSYGRTVEVDNKQFEKKDSFISPYYRWSDADASNYVFNNNSTQDSSDDKKRDIEGYKWYKNHPVNEYAVNSKGAKKFRNSIETFNDLMKGTLAIESSELESGVVAVAWINGIPTKKTTLFYSTAGGINQLQDDWKLFLNDNYALVTLPK